MFDEELNFTGFLRKKTPIDQNQNPLSCKLESFFIGIQHWRKLKTKDLKPTNPLKNQKQLNFRVFLDQKMSDRKANFVYDRTEFLRQPCAQLRPFEFHMRRKKTTSFTTNTVKVAEITSIIKLFRRKNLSKTGQTKTKLGMPSAFGMTFFRKFFQKRNLQLQLHFVTLAIFVISGRFCRR